MHVCAPDAATAYSTLMPAPPQSCKSPLASKILPIQSATLMYSYLLNCLKLCKTRILKTFSLSVPEVVVADVYCETASGHLTRPSGDLDLK